MKQIKKLPVCALAFAALISLTWLMACPAEEALPDAEGGKLPPDVPLTSLSVKLKNVTRDSVSGELLEPEFLAGKMAYEADAAEASTSEDEFELEIQAAAGSGFTVEILVNNVSSAVSADSAGVTCEPPLAGETVRITVRAYRGAAPSGRPKNYTVNVIGGQISTESNNLYSLYVGHDASSGSRLTPDLTEENLSYSMSPESAGNTNGYVKAKAVSSSATIEMYYNSSLLSTTTASGNVTAAFTVPQSGQPSKLEVKVTALITDGGVNRQSTKTYEVAVTPYQEAMVVYSGTVSVGASVLSAYSGIEIMALTAIDSSASRFGAVLDKTSGTNNFPWTLTVPESWTPQAFTVTLKDSADEKFESRSYLRPAAQTTNINITLNAPAELGYRIFNANDFQFYLTTAAYRTKNFSLANDINLAEYTDADGEQIPWAGPSGYQGILYGNGYSVNNVLFTTSGGNTGIFNTVGNGAEIHDLIVNVPDNSGSPVIPHTGASRFGIIIGQMNTAGTIKFVNVTVNGTIYIERAGTGGSDYLLFGGFIGEMNQLVITNVIFDRCVSNLNINITDNYHGWIVAGGFIGRDMNGVELRNSYSTGAINVVTDKVNMAIFVGGLIGRIDTTSVVNNTRIIENCYTTSPIEVKRAKNTSKNIDYFVGGLVGVTLEANDIRIKNSAALNLSIKALYDDDTVPAIGNYEIGRVVGRLGTGTITDAAAFSAMTLNDGQTTISDGAPDNKNGADASPANLANAAWWQSAPLSWPASVWDFSNLSAGNYPKLKE
ncbi:MAG: hypothetical protein LBC77_07515 [Spirochaetaceae bacterium]|jgi:hypothetical protein|nr:hypothetical protein [Spirochaetaceae bacterium]